MNRWASPESPIAFRADMMRAAEGCVGDESVRPDVGDEFVLGHDALAVLNQESKHLEDLWFDGDGFTIPS